MRYEILNAEIQGSKPENSVPICWILKSILQGYIFISKGQNWFLFLSFDYQILVRIYQVSAGN